VAGVGGGRIVEAGEGAVVFYDVMPAHVDEGEGAIFREQGFETV